MLMNSFSKIQFVSEKYLTFYKVVLFVNLIVILSKKTDKVIQKPFKIRIKVL